MSFKQMASGQQEPKTQHRLLPHQSVTAYPFHQFSFTCRTYLTMAATTKSACSSTTREVTTATSQNGPWAASSMILMSGDSISGALIRRSPSSITPHSKASLCEIIDSVLDMLDIENGTVTLTRGVDSDETPLSAALDRDALPVAHACPRAARTASDTSSMDPMPETSTSSPRER